MKKKTRAIAVCAMLAALSVVLMLLGAVLELGIYACPLFVGLCFIPVGQKYGRKYHVALYIASGILCFLFVPNIEENLMLAGLFGWYPIVRPFLQRLNKWIGWILKLLFFNATVVAIEWLVMTVLVPEMMPDVLLWVLLILGNITFLAYDLMIPRWETLTGRIVKYL